jgi:hypothetical protein
MFSISERKRRRKVMMTAARIMTAAGVALALMANAAFAGDIPFSGFLGNATVYEQLKPGQAGQAKLRWMKEGTNSMKFNRFMVDSVIFFVADKADYKGIDPQEMKELCDQFNKDLAAAFRDKWPIVAEPGPDVARLRIAITNIHPSKPGLSAVTSVIPVGVGVSLVKKGATGGWSGSGDTCIEVMFMDSMTEEVLAMVVDQQKAAFEQRFTKWGSAADAFKMWSEKIVDLIDLNKGVKREPPK